jgi:hypothetical protein
MQLLSSLFTSSTNRNPLLSGCMVQKQTDPEIEHLKLHVEIWKQAIASSSGSRE